MAPSPVVSVLAEERWRALQQALRTSKRFELIGRLSNSDFPLARCVDVDSGTPLVVRFVDLRDQRISSRKPGAAPPDVVMVDDDSALVVERFVHGASLRECLEPSRSPFNDYRLLIDLLEQGSLALKRLHERGWSHGDVGPHNFRLAERFQFTLVGTLWADVQGPPLPRGIEAHVAEGESLRELGFSQALGRAGYLAPAQLGLESSGRDYYALAATTLRLLSSRAPSASLLEATLAGSVGFREMLRMPAWNTRELLALLIDLAVSMPTNETSVSPSGLVWGATASTLEKPPLRDDAQFTVYRPRRLDKERFSTLLVFAHSAERAPGEEPDAPPARVRQRARERLKSEFSHVRAATVDSLSVPLDATLRLVPQVAGAQFNPPSREFKWLEEDHLEEFRLRAAGHVPEGTRLTGTLQVLCGRLLLAEVNLTFDVITGLSAPAERDVSTAHAYRKIFVSYSTRDADVVSEVKQYIRLLGDTIIQDCLDLRSGERWAPRIEELIRSADIFQLFWSTNAMQSRFVEQEWRYALTVPKPNFVRPLYWETPMPADGARGLPPEELGRLHFQPLLHSSPREAVITMGLPAADDGPPSDPYGPGRDGRPSSSGGDPPSTRAVPYDAPAGMETSASKLPRLLVILVLTGLLAYALFRYVP